MVAVEQLKGRAAGPYLIRTTMMLLVAAAGPMMG